MAGLNRLYNIPLKKVLKVINIDEKTLVVVNAGDVKKVGKGINVTSYHKFGNVKFNTKPFNRIIFVDCERLSRWESSFTKKFYKLQHCDLILTTKADIIKDVSKFAYCICKLDIAFRKKGVSNFKQSFCKLYKNNKYLTDWRRTKESHIWGLGDLAEVLERLSKWI